MPVVQLTGELDIATVEKALPLVDSILAEAPAHLVFDLGELEFMDSPGIALLVCAVRRVRRVELRNPSPSLRQVIEITGIAHTFVMVS